MIHIQKYIETHNLTEDVRMLLQVHDELVFEIREPKLEEVVPELSRIMEGVLSLEETQGVPILVDAKVGDNWEEMEKFQTKR